MRPKLKNRVLRNLRPAIEIAERLYDSVRDNEPEMDDRQDALDQITNAVEHLNLARSRLMDDLHELAPAE